MNQHRKYILLSMVAVLLCAIVVYGAMPVAPVLAEYQTTNAAIQKKQAELKNIESKLAAVDQAVKQSQSAISSAEDKYQAELEHKKLLDEKLSLVAESITASEELLAEYDAQIAGKEAEIAAKESEIAHRYEVVIEWMRIDYELSSVNQLQLILSSESISDFLSSVEMFSSMMDYQSSVMDGLNGDLVDLRAQKEELDVYRAEQKQASEKLTLQKENYEKLIAESKEYMASLQNTIDQSQQQIQEAQAEKDKLVASRNELNKQLEEELEKLAQQNAVYVGGTYIWPLNALKYKRISSPYGWRTLNGQADFHPAIDIPCDYGADIWAANAGTVVKATWHYSYGYYVVVDHGGGQTTLYAHNSQLLVKEGQTVKKGQVIAKAGATGSAYGVHLHFEVRINGKAVNPTGYVSPNG